MSQQLFTVSSLGGYLTNDQLSKQIRHRSQPLMKFRQFVRPEPAAGKARGSKVYFDKISNISTAGGTLTETDTIPKRNFTITQGSLTLQEWGNSIPFTLKLQTLADITVPENIKVVLRNDMAKVLDSAAAAQFKTSDIKATIVNTATTSFSYAGVAGWTAAASLSDKNVRDIIDNMKKLLIPAYDGDNYVAIHSTNSIRGLYDFFEAKAVQTTMKPLFTGEVGTYYKCRHIEETNVLVNTIGSSSVYGEAIFFGDDAVREGIAIPEEIRIDIPKDFGRDQGIAWYGLLGFQIVWDYSGDGEGRIVHVTSL